MREASKRYCVLTVQALAEFYYASTRKRIANRARASSYSRHLIQIFPIVTADTSCLVDAMDATAEHAISFWEAMLWSVARKAGCSAILSEERQDGRRLGGVVVLNPFNSENQGQVETLLRP